MKQRLVFVVHSRAAEIEQLRAAILASDTAITERVKWNAPSFVGSAMIASRSGSVPATASNLSFTTVWPKRSPDG